MYIRAKTLETQQYCEGGNCGTMQAERGEELELELLSDSWVTKESYQIIHRWRKIFVQITVALIFLLCVVILSHGYVSSYLFRGLLPGEPNIWNFEDGLVLFGVVSGEIRRGWISYWVFKAVYLVFTLAFSLLSTSAVVYLVACAYTGKETAFGKVISVVPTVWKRLLVTFLWSSWVMSVYNLIMVGIIILLAAMVTYWSVRLAIVATIIVSLIYWTGLVHITMIWQLASVASVLEDVNGSKAMTKSMALLKGKTGAVWMNFYVPVVMIILLRDLFDYFAVFGTNIPAGVRIIGGISCFLVLLMVILLCLVFQTMIYFVCKSYHHEIIDKSALAGHLEGYAGHYVPLAATKDVELQQVQV